MEKSREPIASEEPRCVAHDVPDDVLRLILLRLDSPLWLVRAACACKRWRRIVTDKGRAFLRLASSLHPPVILGHYHSYHVGGYRFVPSSPATPIRFSLDFFPRELVQHHHTIDRWHVADCHGGLILLHDGFSNVADLVVCDPLSRQCRDIHHPPDQTSRPPMGSYMPRAFLLDGGNNDGNISISNFRVLLYHTCSDVTKVYAFSAADGGDWRLVRQSTAAFDDHDDRFVGSHMGHVIGRIGRSLYMASPAGSVRVLDNASMVFSEVNLPIRTRKSCLDYGYNSTFAIVHGASPEPTALPATASIVHVCGEDLELFRRVPTSGEWVLEHSIRRLSEATRGLPGYPELSRWKAVDVIAGGTRLVVLKVSLSRGNRSWSWLISLDVDTMQMQVVTDVATYLSHEMKRILYTLPWPQFLTGLPG